MRQFDGGVALVTGGGSGIGAMTAIRLGQQGAAVAVVDRDVPAAESVAERIRGDGAQAVAIGADISDPEANRAMFAEAERAFGPVRHCFLNAGMLQPYGPFPDISLEVFDRVIAVNLRGAFLGLQAALAHMASPGSCVVTSSTAGRLGFADAAAYSASKHGVIGLVRSAARDFAARGLRVNVICPGQVLTPMGGGPSRTEPVAPDALPFPEYRGALEAQHITETVLFLLGGGSGGISGEAVTIDAALLSAFPPVPL